MSWSPKRRLLAVRTLRRQLFLYRIDPPSVLWASESLMRAAGYDLLDDARLVCHCYPESADSGAGETVTIEVAEEPADHARVRTISVVSPCRTFGMSGSGRFLLLARGHDASDPPGSLDLGRWHAEPPGIYQANLLPITGLGLEPDISFAWLAEGARKLIVRQTPSEDGVDWFVGTMMGNAHPVEPPFRHLESRVRLPEYPWALPGYLWSPDGRWFAARVREEIPTGWDEIPVGGPSLSSFVAGYDGETGLQLWSHEVQTVHCPFEWTDVGVLEAAEQLWDPVSGNSLGPAPS